MTYDSFRSNGGPTQHEAHYHVADVDVLAAGFILAFCILGLAFFLVAPGFPGIKRLYFLIRVVVSLFVGSAILLGVLGQDWEKSEIETRTPYKAFTTTEINATIGAKIGLGSVNVTLKGNPVQQTVDHFNSTEHIDYNERFHWAWRQGRFGFGPYAGRINQEFRQGQYRGMPLPILWVAEYFTLDGELIRWGRSFRTAGWYTWQVLWTAFPLWIIANVLSVMVLTYSGIAFMLTGGFMLMSIIIYACIRYGTQPLVIPFEHATMEFEFGPSFWLTMTGGIVSVLYGMIIWFMDFKFPRQISDFFGIDILQDSENFYHKEEEQEVEQSAPRSAPRGGVARRLRNRAASSKFSQKFARSSRRIPRRDDFLAVQNQTFSNDEHIYENEGADNTMIA